MAIRQEAVNERRFMELGITKVEVPFYPERVRKSFQIIRPSCVITVGLMNGRFVGVDSNGLFYGASDCEYYLIDALQNGHKVKWFRRGKRCH